MKILPVFVIFGLCTCLSSRAQLPIYRLAAGSQPILYQFDFSNPTVGQPSDEGKYNSRVTGFGSTVVDIYDGATLLFYEREDTFFSANHTAIFEFELYRDWRWSMYYGARGPYGFRVNTRFGFRYGEIYTIRNAHTRSTDVLLLDGNDGALLKYTLPDSATSWMTDEQLKCDTLLFDMPLQDITATRTADGLGTWLLLGNREYVYVVKLQDDKLTLVHQYDSLPGGWGGMELFSDIALNNKGNELAVGSYSIVNPNGILADSTRLSVYRFDQNTGVLSHGKILLTCDIYKDPSAKTVGGNLYGEGDYVPSNPKWDNTASLGTSTPMNWDHPADYVEYMIGSIFVNLCYTTNDSILYASHHGAPFGVKNPWESFQWYDPDLYWGPSAPCEGTFSHSNIMAVNVYTGQHLLVQLDFFKGYQNILQANGQLWVHVNEVRGLAFWDRARNSPKWYIIPYPEDVFARDTIEVEDYYWPLRPHDSRIDIFNRGLQAAKSLDLAAVDSCMQEVRLHITADTSFFEHFRLSQGAASIQFTKQQLVDYNYMVPCPNFQHTLMPISLTGIRNGYNAQTTTKRIELKKENIRPQASFTVSDTVGCQWISYQLHNKSVLARKDAEVTYHWTFGNGSDTTIVLPSGSASTQANASVRYTSSGKYVVNLAIDDGYCTASFTIEDSITILQAPRPGLHLSDSVGCEPLALWAKNSYESATDSIVYTWGNGTATQVRCIPSCDTAKTAYQLHNDGVAYRFFEVTQALYGATGCVTYDTAHIRVMASFLPTDTPYLALVSISQNQQVELTWDSLRHAAYYTVYRNDMPQDTTSATTCTLADPKKAQEVATYSMRAVNHCQEKSAPSNGTQNIVLGGIRSEDNTTAALNWNTYVGWQNGVASYDLEELKKNGEHISISGLLPANEVLFSDYNFLTKQANEPGVLFFDKCYRLKSQEHTTRLESYSNTFCLAYRPVLFAPNAFTPNADGLNDSYAMVAYGYTEMLLEVYNTWGEKIHQGLNWDGTVAGTLAPSGVYTILFSGKTIEGSREFKKFAVHLIR